MHIPGLRGASQRFLSGIRDVARWPGWPPRLCAQSGTLVSWALGSAYPVFERPPSCAPAAVPAGLPRGKGPKENKHHLPSGERLPGCLQFCLPQVSLFGAPPSRLLLAPPTLPRQPTGAQAPPSRLRRGSGAPERECRAYSPLGLQRNGLGLNAISLPRAQHFSLVCLPHPGQTPHI